MRRARANAFRAPLSILQRVAPSRRVWQNVSSFTLRCAFLHVGRPHRAEWKSRPARQIGQTVVVSSLTWPFLPIVSASTTSLRQSGFFTALERRPTRKKLHPRRIYKTKRNCRLMKAFRAKVEARACIGQILRERPKRSFGNERTSQFRARNAERHIL